MAWLSGYTYRKKGAVNATTAGAQTLYQLKLIVGESSGASGADVHCENHCLDFPNDIRFTKEDGETKHDYWVDTSSLEGTTPNRKVSVWIEVASIPASGSVDFYMYYRKSSDNGESDGYDTFHIFDDFEGAGSFVKDDLDTFIKLGLYEGNNPVIPQGGASDSDKNIREIGNILHEPGESSRKYKTFYTGYNVGFHTDEKIHYAYSEDGKSWTKSSSNPVVSNRRAEDPYVVKNGSTYYLFAEDKEAGGENKIRRWHSSDCESWTDDGQLTGIVDGQSPTVWIEDTTWYLIYERFPAHADIALATSSDGLAWTDDGSNPVMEYSDTNWVTGAIVPDSIIKKGSTYHMFYHGYDGSYWRVGKATSTNLTSWIDYSKSPFSSDTLDPVSEVMVFYDTEDVVLYVGYDLDGIHRGYPIKSSKWTEHKQGSDDAIIRLETTQLRLAGKADTISSGNVQSITQLPNNNFLIQVKRKANNESYRDISIGSGSLVGMDSGTDWWHTTFYNGYIFLIQSGAANHRGHVKETDGVSATLTNLGTAPGITDWHIEEHSYLSNGTLESKFDGANSISNTDTTHLNLAKYILLSQGEYSSGAGGDSYFDFVLVRKYVSPEPTWGSWGGQTAQKTFMVNAILINQVTKTFIADTILVQRHTKTFTVDALTKAIQTKTFTADAIIVNHNTQVFTTDAILSGRISGITRNSGGFAFGNCTVWLFKTSDKSFVEETTSNGSGEYTFDGLLAGIDYFIRAFKDGTPNVFGTTDDNLEAN